MRWALSTLDGLVHLLEREGDHPHGALKARCSELLPPFVTQYDQPIAAPACEHCSAIFLATFDDHRAEQDA